MTLPAFKKLSLCAHWLAFLMLPLYVHPQNPVAFPVTADQGLPNQTVYSLLEDKRGFLWVGTDAGLYRYDGIRFMPFRNENQASKSLTGLCQSPDGRIYAHNFQGQAFFVESDSLYWLDTWDKGRINDLSCDAEGDLWVSSYAGIHRYRSRNQEWETVEIERKSPFAKAVFTDKKGGKWGLCVPGLVSLSGSKPSVFPVPFTGVGVGDFLLASETEIPLVFKRTDGLIFQLKDGVVQPLYHAELNAQLAGRKVTRVTGDQRGRIWIFTYTGIVLFDPAKGSCEVLFPEISFSGGIQDSRGEWWLGTLQEGLMRVPDLDSRIWTLAEGISSSNRISRVAGMDEQIFMSTFQGIVGNLQNANNSLKTYSLNQKVDIELLKGLAGRILFGAKNDVFSLSGEKIIPVIEGLAPAKDILELGGKHIVATSAGTIWYDTPHKIPLDTITPLWTRTLAFDEGKGILFAGTDKGVIVFRMSEGNWTQERVLLTGMQIISMQFVADKNALFVLCFDGTVYRIKEDFSDEFLFALAPEATGKQLLVHEGNVFLATDRGIWIWKDKEKALENFDRVAGLAAEQIHGITIMNHEAWLATDKGLQRIPLPLEQSNSRIRLYLKSIFAGNQAQDLRSPIELAYRSPLKITWEAAALGYEGKFQIAYRFADDVTWHYLPGDLQSIEFPSLSTGDFALNIKAVDRHGHDASDQMVISGHVSPPFWQQWWFITLAAAMLILLMYLLFLKRLAVMRKRQMAELMRMRLLHELRLSKETALRAQMNPHFIFNVLNSIKSFIYENEKKKAAVYLQRFSDLIRSILDQSAASWVALDDEISFLKTYVELESISMTGEFDVDFEIDEDIDTGQTMIPSLMLQPFIENALKHGLRHKEGHKRLHVKFKQDHDEGILTCEIEDNGIGREAAGRINESQKRAHKSFSAEAIDRMAMWNKSQPGLFSVRYVDLKDAEGNGTGTWVEIKIKERGQHESTDR